MDELRYINLGKELARKMPLGEGLAWLYTHHDKLGTHPRAALDAERVDEVEALVRDMDEPAIQTTSTTA